MLGLTLVIVLALQLFYRRTPDRQGGARLLHQPAAARLQGISYSRVVLFSFALAGAISAAAGVHDHAHQLHELLLRCAARAQRVRGRGAGRPGQPARRRGGRASLGMLEALGVGYVSAGYKDAIAFVILLLVLFLRPQGLLGARVVTGEVSGGDHHRPSCAGTPGFFLFAVVVMTRPRLRQRHVLPVRPRLHGHPLMMVVGLAAARARRARSSLGHAAFVGIGAYGAAILTTKAGLDPWLAMVVAALMAAGVAAVIGMPTLKLKGHYLAMATLGFNEIVFILMVQLKSLTNGTDGITGIPSLSIGGLDFGQPRPTTCWRGEWRC